MISIEEVSGYLKRIQMNSYQLRLEFNVMKAYIGLYNSFPSDKWRLGQQNSDYTQSMDEKYLHCMLGIKDMYDLKSQIEKGAAACTINELFGVENV
jgi:hypothetical protein